MNPRRTSVPRLALASVIPALAWVATAADAGVVTIQPLKVPRVSAAVKVRPGAFNAAGNIVVGYTGDAQGNDVLLELDPQGATVWECRLRPGGTLAAFARAATGTTLVAQWLSGQFSRVIAVDPEGRARSGFQLVADGAAPPRPSSLHSLPGGGALVSGDGWAVELSKAWRVAREMRHRSLLSAAPVADGARWLCAFRDPPRFAAYDPATHSLAPISIDALCHVWEAARAEEAAPGRWRFYGCFCLPQPAPEGAPVPRKTLEVVETDAEGKYLWGWGSVRASRIEESGAQRCATWTRAVAHLPEGRMIVLDGYPADCRVAVLNVDGELVRVLFAPPGSGATGGDRGTSGERSCGIVNLRLLEAPAPR